MTPPTANSRTATRKPTFAVGDLMVFTAAVAAVCGLVAGESWQIGAAALCCAGLFLIAGYLSGITLVAIGRVIGHAMEVQEWSPLTRIYRWMPAIAMVSVMVILAIVLGNHVIEFSHERAQLVGHWAWGLMPIGGILAWFRQRTQGNTRTCLMDPESETPNHFLDEDRPSRPSSS